MEIKVCPSTLQVGYDKYSPMALRHLFFGKEVSPFLDFDFEKDVDREFIAVNMEKVSVSGAQEKMSAIIKNGIICLSAEGERSTHILKPAPMDYALNARKQIPANEHLTMQIAKQVYGIITAENGLCLDKNEHLVYITKRFDILPDGNKRGMVDFAVLVGKNEQSDGKYYKYEGCYEDISDAIKKYVVTFTVALERFFKIMLFNYIYCNGDAHLKNFSVIRQGDEYVLAPAYDLMNTNLHLEGDDLGLTGGLLRSGWKSDIYQRTGHPCRTDFETFGLQIGLSPKRVNAIVSEFLSIPEFTKSLISRSFLEPKMKRSYLRTITERLSRFLRQSPE